MVCLILGKPFASGAVSGPDKIKVIDPALAAKIDSLNEEAFEVKRQDVSAALGLLHKALTLSLQHQYRKGEAINYLYEGGIYQQKGYAKRALYLFFQSVEISKQLKDTFNIARANHQIANAYRDADRLPEAEVLYKEALGQFMALKQGKDVINIKNNLALVLLDRGRYSEAEKYLQEALAESKASRYTYGLKKAYFHLGLLYKATGELAKARNYMGHALVMDQEKHDSYGLSLATGHLAVIASEEGKNAEAENLALASLRYAREIKATQLEIEALERLASINQSRNHLQHVIAWQDSLVRKQAELYETERTEAINMLDLLKEKQEKQAAFEKQTLLAAQKAEVTHLILQVSLVASVVLLAIAYFWYRNFKRARSIGKELAVKNQVIQKSSVALDQLNKAISKQNLRLEQANELKNKLFSILSHDLRKPLNNTKGLLHIINSGMVTQEQYAPKLEELEKQYVRSSDLLENLLVWIKSQLEGAQVQVREVALSSLLQDVVIDHEEALAAKSVVVRNQVQEDLSVLGDPEMLKVVFRNLLSNAIKFTKQGGEVTITSKAVDGVTIAIKDQGVGISEENLQKIKQKMYFTTVGTARETGSGFGLMICDDLLRQSGGGLSISSTQGKGSVFAVNLPASLLPQEKGVQQSMSLM